MLSSVWIFPPTNVLVIEDFRQRTRISDIAAGLKTIVTVNNYTAGQNFSRAVLVASDLGEPDLPCRGT